MGKTVNPKLLFAGAALEETLAMSARNRARVALLEKEMLAIDASDSIAEACAAAAERTRGMIPGATGRASLSAKSFARLYRAWRRDGWRALAAEYATARARLPRAFVLHWQQIYVRYRIERGGTRAYDALLAEWNRWRRGAEGATPIPGYDSPPEEFGTTGAPRGWSLRNLMRHLPERVVVDAIKKGRRAATSRAPAVLTTRKNLEPGQVFIFDDVWHDNLVAFPGQRRLVRPLELGAIDLASGCKVSYGLRPRVRDEANEGFVQLAAGDMAMLVADVLCNVGVHPDGCLLCVEHGTAAITAAQEEFLLRASGGKIRVQRGGVDALSAFDGGFAGAPRGNSRFKAALESLHNLFHAHTSALPGYTGNSRTPPEDAQGEEAEFRRMIAAAERMELPAEAVAKLSVGNLSWDEFTDAYARIVERVNARTEHALEGWEDRMITEVRLTRDGEWQRADRALLGDAVFAALTSSPSTHRVRRASPLEVWRGGAGKLARIPFAALIDFVAPRKADGTLDLPLRRMNAQRQFVLRGGAESAETLIFSAFVRDARGHTLLLDEAREYKLILNPFRPDELLVLDANDVFVGSAFDRVARFAKNDADALAREAGIRRGQFARLLDPADALAQETRERRIRALAENARVVAQAKEDAKLLEGALAREADREEVSAAEAADEKCLDDFLGAVGGADDEF